MAAILYNTTNVGTTTVTSLNFAFVTPPEVTLSADFSSIKPGAPTNFSGTSYTITDLNISPGGTVTFSVDYGYLSGDAGDVYNGYLTITGESELGSDQDLITTAINVVAPPAPPPPAPAPSPAPTPPVPNNCQVWEYNFYFDESGDIPNGVDGSFEAATFDTDGNLITVGSVMDGGTIYQNYIVVTKWGPEGNVIWTKYIGYPRLYENQYNGGDVITDLDNNIYVQSVNYPDTLDSPSLHLKFDPSGTLISQRNVQAGEGIDSISLGQSILVSDGIIYAPGMYNADTYNYGVYKLDFDGNLIWKNQKITPAGGFFGGYFINGYGSDEFNVLYTDVEDGDNPNIAFVIDKFNSSGVFQTSLMMMTSYSVTGSGGVHTTLPDGTIYANIVLGKTGDSTGYSYIAKIDPSGSLLWVKQLSQENQTKGFYGLEGANDGVNVYFIGYARWDGVVIIKINGLTETVSYFATIRTAGGGPYHEYNFTNARAFNIQGNYIGFAGWGAWYNDYGVVFKIPKDLENYDSVSPLSIEGKPGFSIDVELDRIFFIADVTSSFSIVPTVTPTFIDPAWAVAPETFECWDGNYSIYGGIFEDFDNACDTPPPAPSPPTPPTPLPIASLQIIPDPTNPSTIYTWTTSISIINTSSFETSYYLTAIRNGVTQPSVSFGYNLNLSSGFWEFTVTASNSSGTDTSPTTSIMVWPPFITYRLIGTSQLSSPPPVNNYAYVYQSSFPSITFTSTDAFNHFNASGSEYVCGDPVVTGTAPGSIFTTGLYFEWSANIPYQTYYPTALYDGFSCAAKPIDITNPTLLYQSPDSATIIAWANVVNADSESTYSSGSVTNPEYSWGTNTPSGVIGNKAEYNISKLYRKYCPGVPYGWPLGYLDGYVGTYNYIPITWTQLTTEIPEIVESITLTHDATGQTLTYNYNSYVGVYIKFTPTPP